MHHVNPDVLALLALGEPVATPSQLEHVASCDGCRDELDNLARAAIIGRSTLSAGELLEPSPRVWSRISDELVLDGAERDEHTVAPVTPIQRGRSWRIPVAVAAAVVLILGSVGAVWLALRPAPEVLLASATLDALPDWAGSSGEAQVEETADGARVVQVSVEAPADDDGFREVWLITSDATELVSLGVMEGDMATFAVPDGLDLDKYDLVDISSEKFDGDPQHSGDSIVRGQLS